MHPITSYRICSSTRICLSYHRPPSRRWALEGYPRYRHQYPTWTDGGGVWLSCARTARQRLYIYFTRLVTLPFGFLLRGWFAHPVRCLLHLIEYIDLLRELTHLVHLVTTILPTQNELMGITISPPSS